MKKIISALFVGILVLSWSTQCWAPTSSATASFTAAVPSRVAVSLTKDDNSAATTAGAVRFDKYDDVDVAGGSPGYMYAPYRSLIGKNWHLASIVANGGSTVTLSVNASLTGITTDKLKVWFGGFFIPGSSTEIPGTKSTDWEAMGSSKTTSGPFSGTCPFNYQLNVATLGSGTYSGTLTYTLTQ